MTRAFNTSSGGGSGKTRRAPAPNFGKAAPKSNIKSQKVEKATAVPKPSATPKPKSNNGVRRGPVDKPVNPPVKRGPVKK